MGMFIGREEETCRLLHFARKPGQGAALLYGRRRVGKTELTQHIMDLWKQESGPDSVCIYFECRETTEAHNAASLSETAAACFQYDVPFAFMEFEKILDFIFQKSHGRNVLLVLDEYPYLKGTVTGMDSILKSILDKHKSQSRLKLILCGSYMDIMKGLLKEENPLYGRFEEIVELEPMDYYETAQFYPAFSNEDKVTLYSVFGGIPYYHAMIEVGCSAEDNIKRLLLEKNARLQQEIPYLLNTEMRKISNANAVFEVLAAGTTKFKDLRAKSHIPSDQTLKNTLDKLIEIGFVEKEFPINDPYNAKKSHYRIKDPLARFYYTYLYRNISRLSRMNPQTFYELFIQEDFESQFIPHSFENICKEFLIRKNIANKLPLPFFDLGKYYYDDPVQHINGEFDIVSNGPGGYIFYEAKYRNKPMSAQMIRHEIEQVKRSGLSCCQYGFFSRSGFEPEPEADQIFYTLEDLYA